MTKDDDRPAFRNCSSLGWFTILYQLSETPFMGELVHNDDSHHPLLSVERLALGRKHANSLQLE